MQCLRRSKPLIWRDADPNTADDYKFVRVRGSGAGGKKRHRHSRRRTRVPPELVSMDELSTITLPSSKKNAPSNNDSSSDKKKSAADAASLAGSVPWRQYYHSRSRLPMQNGGWEIDSDDESDNGWLDDMGQAVSTMLKHLNDQVKGIL